MIYKGSEKQKDIYKGSTKIGKVYKGSTLVYQSKIPAGQVIFSSNNPGTYTITITSKQNYYIELVGGGAGAFAYLSSNNRGGGSGACIYGTILLDKGIYTLVIGSGTAGVIGPNSYDVSDAGSTTFLNNIAGGGLGHSQIHPSETYLGGIATVTSSGLSGINGNNTITGTTNGGYSVYDNTATGYGAGGFIYDAGGIWAPTNGQNGFARIITA